MLTGNKIENWQKNLDKTSDSQIMDKQNKIGANLRDLAGWKFHGEKRNDLIGNKIEIWEILSI